VIVVLERLKNRVRQLFHCAKLPTSTRFKAEQSHKPNTDFQLKGRYDAENRQNRELSPGENRSVNSLNFPWNSMRKFPWKFS
jgi:hypothetical protein